MDLRDSLELIQSTAVDASNPQLLDDQRDKKIFYRDGAKIEVAKQTSPRVHSAGDLETLHNLSSDLSSIWHDGNQVVLIIDDQLESDRLDRATWLLTTSEKWQAASGDASRPKSQKDFITFLKQNLRDEVNAALPGFLTSLAKVKFIKNTSGEGTVQQGRESMGRTIEAQVTGTADFPETVILKLRRWGELEFSGEIEFSLIIDADNTTFALKPLADSFKTAESAAHKWLGELISEEAKCPVYFGRP